MMRFSLRHLSPASWRIQIIAHNSALMMLRHGQCYPTDDEARTFPANFCTRYSQIPAWGGRIVFSPATRGLVTLLFGFCGGCDEPDELFGRDSLEDGSGLLHLASRGRTKLGNSSVVSVFGVMVGGEVGGIVGIYLSIPLMVVIRVIWRRFISAVPRTVVPSEFSLSPRND